MEPISSFNNKLNPFQSPEVLDLHLNNSTPYIANKPEEEIETISLRNNDEYDNRNDNLTKDINQIKTTIEQLKNSGEKVTFDEENLVDSYRINIKIDKQ